MSAQAIAKDTAQTLRVLTLLSLAASAALWLTISRLSG
jgi:hypothetical protein